MGKMAGRRSPHIKYCPIFSNCKNQLELHTANAASGKDQPSNAIQPSDDPVIEEWNLNQDESSQQQSPRFSSNRGGRDQEGSSGRSNLRLHSQDNGSDTQTGQS
jgi:hypothetical protein